MPDENHDAFDDELPEPLDEQSDEEPFPTGEEIEEKAKQAKR